jgi:hypothetical protein
LLQQAQRSKSTHQVCWQKLLLSTVTPVRLSIDRQKWKALGRRRAIKAVREWGKGAENAIQTESLILCEALSMIAHLAKRTRTSGSESSTMIFVFFTRLLLCAIVFNDLGDEIQIFDLIKYNLIRSFLAGLFQREFFKSSNS